MNDELYMKRAISLAKMATGHTSPNPFGWCRRSKK